MKLTLENYAEHFGETIKLGCGGSGKFEKVTHRKEGIYFHVEGSEVGYTIARTIEREPMTAGDLMDKYVELNEYTCRITDIDEENNSVMLYGRYWKVYLLLEQKATYSDTYKGEQKELYK